MDIIFFNTEDKSTIEVQSTEELLRVQTDKQGFYWLDLNDPNTDHLTQTLNALGINSDWPNFFNRPEISPHMRDTPWQLAFYLFDVVNSESLLDTDNTIYQIETAPILVILGQNYVITYQQKQLDLIEFAKRDCAENFKMSGQTPAFVVFLLMQHAMYHCARLNLANDNFLDKIEANVLLEREAEYLAEISIVGLNILALKKLNANLHIILLVIVTKENHVIGAAARNFFNQMLQNTLGIKTAIDSSRDLLNGVNESIHAGSARETEQVMRVLTILSAAFMPLTLITGIYGMNFHDMPELNWHYGYYITLGIMGCILTGFLTLFYHKGWMPRWKKRTR